VGGGSADEVVRQENATAKDQVPVKEVIPGEPWGSRI
jgi:hypothetical protein